MQNQVSRPAAAPTAAPSLPVLRAQLTALTFHSPYLSPAEQLQANHHIHDCQDPVRLARWLRNLPAALARREAEQRAATLAHYAALLQGPQPRPVTPLPYPGDCRASARDRRAAVRFRPARTLCYAHLLFAR